MVVGGGAEQATEGSEKQLIRETLQPRESGRTHDGLDSLELLLGMERRGGKGRDERDLAEVMWDRRVLIQTRRAVFEMTDP